MRRRWRLSSGSSARPFLAAIVIHEADRGGSCGGQSSQRFCVIVQHLLQHESSASRRAFLRGIASSASVLALGGCASMATSGTRYDASSLAVEPTLLVATTRKPVNGARAKPWFGPERASAMTVGRVKLTAPDDNRFSLAAAGLGSWRLDGVETASGDVSNLLAQGGGSDVLIYVHGFKNTFETAALDAAQLADGIRFRGQTMVFSWPSKAGLFDYAYDRDSAMYSRDAFERVLHSLATSPSIGRVHIVAHSMGTMLTLEGLRQLYARYGDSLAGKIGAVVFASPDIDMDVFSSATQNIGPLTRKITVITATNDRALALSGRLAGGMTRVGAAEKAAIEQLGVRVIDASESGWGVINHDLFLSNAEVRQVIRRSIDTSAA
jgi:esterase/lipase superfamily enzyme